MKKLTLTLVCALVCTLTLMAQPKGEKKFSPEQFKERMEKALTKHAELTAEEAKAVLPIFMEMKEKQRKIGKKMAKIKKVGKDETLSDAEYAKRIKQVEELKEDMAEMESEYYEKMVKAIPAQKVWRIMKADDQFHRQMLSHFNQRGNGNNPRPGMKPGRGNGPRPGSSEMHKRHGSRPDMKDKADKSQTQGTCSKAEGCQGSCNKSEKPCPEHTECAE